MHCHCTHMHATYHGIDMLASQARLLAMKADYEAAKSMVGGVRILAAMWLSGRQGRVLGWEGFDKLSMLV